MANPIGLVQNEYTLEVRFQPNSKVIDRRGDWAAKLAEHMRLTKWRIDPNRIDVISDDGDRHFFMSFGNAGMVLHDVPNRDFFPNVAKQFLAFAFSLPEFGKNVRVNRIGVRGVFCTPYEGDFEALVSRYERRVVGITNEARAFIADGLEVVDTAALFTFSDGTRTLNFQSGPMKEGERSPSFERREVFPPVWMYTDMDFWMEPRKSLSAADTIESMEVLFFGTWDRHPELRDLLLGG